MANNKIDAMQPDQKSEFISRLQIVRRSLDNIYCDLRDYGHIKLDPEDPYSLDIEDVRDFVMAALQETDNAYDRLSQLVLTPQKQATIPHSTLNATPNISLGRFAKPKRGGIH